MANNHLALSRSYKFTFSYSLNLSLKNYILTIRFQGSLIHILICIKLIIYGRLVLLSVKKLFLKCPKNPFYKSSNVRSDSKLIKIA